MCLQQASCGHGRFTRRRGRRRSVSLAFRLWQIREQTNDAISVVHDRNGQPGHVPVGVADRLHFLDPATTDQSSNNGTTTFNIATTSRAVRFDDHAVNCTMSLNITVAQG